MERNVEDKFKNNAIAEMSKICTVANSSTELGNSQEFKDFCKTNKQSACYNCISLNCFSKQKASREAKMKKKISNKTCPKKQLTLGEVKAMSTTKDAPKTDEGTSVGATATLVEDDLHNDEFADVMTGVVMDNECDSTFIANMARFEITTPQTESIMLEKLQI